MSDLDNSELYPEELSDEVWYEIIGLSDDERQHLEDPSLVIHWDFLAPKETADKEIKK